MIRRKGFTLVELLIVLAVIAALIATISPLALNAIRRSRATQVAHNIRALSNALENAAYLNGFFTSNVGGVDRIFISGPNPVPDNPNPIDHAIWLEHIGRDIDGTSYAVIYKVESGEVEVVIGAIVNVNTASVISILPNATDQAPFDEEDDVLIPDGDYIPVLGIEIDDFPNIWYTFSFNVY